MTLPTNLEKARESLKTAKEIMQHREELEEHVQKYGLPTAIYKCQILRASETATNKGTPCIKITLEIIDGYFKTYQFDIRLWKSYKIAEETINGYSKYLIYSILQSAGAFPDIHKRINVAYSEWFNCIINKTVFVKVMVNKSGFLEIPVRDMYNGWLNDEQDYLAQFDK